MKAKDIALILVVVVLVAFTPNSPISVLARDVLADARPAPLSAGPVGTSFAYQGQLTDGGVPADGVYDFQFKLWDAETSGGQIGSLVTRGDIAVAGGIFTVELDFGSGAFAGEARWLEIGVRPGDSSDSYTTLVPRQKVTPTPYALFAANAGMLDSQPGAFYQDVSNLNAGTLDPDRFSASVDLTSEGLLGNAAGDIAQNNGVLQTSLNADALDGQHSGAFANSAHNHWGQTWTGSGTGLTLTSSNSTGLSASSTAGSGLTYGVYGTSNSTSGRGVVGWATAGSGSAFGVVGRSDSPAGHGVDGYTTSATGGTGVYGEANATSGGATGVTGISHATDGGVGVYGIGAGTGNTYGVYGWSQSTGGTGVTGYATATTGYTNGVRGRSDSTSGWGGYFDGLGNGVLAIAPASGYIIQGRQYPSDTVKFSVNGAGNVHSYGTVTADGDIITGGSFHYATPQIRKIWIQPAAFIAEYEGCPYYFNLEYGNEVGQDSGYCHMYAPVQLPQGATVTTVDFYFWDGSDADLTMTLWMETGVRHNMASAQTSGKPGLSHIATTSISNPVIDNRFCYYVELHPNPSWDMHNLTFDGVLITYTDADAE